GPPHRGDEIAHELGLPRVMLGVVVALAEQDVAARGEPLDQRLRVDERPRGHGPEPAVQRPAPPGRALELDLGRRRTARRHDERERDGAAARVAHVEAGSARPACTVGGLSPTRVASIDVRDPDMAPHTPHARSAPGNPWRSSSTLAWPLITARR